MQCIGTEMDGDILALFTMTKRSKLAPTASPAIRFMCERPKQRWELATQDGYYIELAATKMNAAATGLTNALMKAQ